MSSKGRFWVRVLLKREKASIFTNRMYSMGVLSVPSKMGNYQSESNVGAPFHFSAPGYFEAFVILPSSQIGEMGKSIDKCRIN